jgi:hypothetical protein
MLGPQRHGTSRHCGFCFSGTFGRSAPDPLDAVLAHTLAGVAQHDCDVTILIGQRDDSRVSASSSFRSAG